MSNAHVLVFHHHDTVETGEVHQRSHTPTPTWAWALFGTVLGLAGWVLDLAVKHPKK